MFEYRCEQCRTTSPPTPSRRAAEATRDRHRDQFHGGHVPDGERIYLADTGRRRRRWPSVLGLVLFGIATAIWDAIRWLAGLLH